MVYDPSDPDKGNVGQCLLSDSVIKMTLYNNVIYAGLADGNLAVFTELSDPRKGINPDVVVKLGMDRIPSIFGSKDSIYTACGSAVVSIDARTHTIEVCIKKAVKVKLYFLKRSNVIMSQDVMRR